MPLVGFQKITETRAKVMTIDYVSNQEGETSILVTEVPPAEIIFGKAAETYINPKTREIWYEYIDRPLTPDEALHQLKEKQDLMQQAIDDLIFGGAL